MNNWDSIYFPIPYEFQVLFERLSNSCKLLLQRPDLSPQYHSHLVKFNHALSRLPIVTVDVDFVVILCKDKSKIKNGSFPWDTCTLELNNSFLRASNSYYEATIFGKPSSAFRQSFYCNSDGYYHLEDVDGLVNYTIFNKWVEGWESFCQDHSTRLTIHNFDEKFDWLQFHDHLAWDRMPSLFCPVELKNAG